MICAISSSDHPIERAAVIAPSNERFPWTYSNEAFRRSARIFSARVGTTAPYPARSGGMIGITAPRSGDADSDGLGRCLWWRTAWGVRRRLRPNLPDLGSTPELSQRYGVVVFRGLGLEPQGPGPLALSVPAARSRRDALTIRWDARAHEAVDLTREPRGRAYVEPIEGSKAV